MKRPEKKELSNEGNRCVQVGEDYIVGYNQSCDDWEKWTEKCQEDFISVSSLPSCKEIEEIIDRHMSERSHITKDDQYSGLVVHPNIHLVKDTAKAIHKRLRGE